MRRLLSKAIVAAGLVASVVVGVAGAPPPPQAPALAGTLEPGPVTREGWWIRVNPANQAANLSWRFGPARNRLSAPVRWWRESGNEFDLPAAQRTLPSLYFAAIGLPYSLPVSFCLFYQNQGVALVEFTAERNVQVEQSQRSAECVP